MTSFNELRTFTNRVFAYAMDFKRPKGHTYDLQTPECENAKSFLENTEQDAIDLGVYQGNWIRSWQQ